MLIAEWWIGLAEVNFCGGWRIHVEKECVHLTNQCSIFRYREQLLLLSLSGEIEMWLCHTKPGFSVSLSLFLAHSLFSLRGCAHSNKNLWNSTMCFFKCVLLSPFLPLPWVSEVPATCTPGQPQPSGSNNESNLSFARVNSAFYWVLL